MHGRRHLYKLTGRLLSVQPMQRSHSMSRQPTRHVLELAHWGVFENVIDVPGSKRRLPVIVCGQIAHSTVQPLKLLHILWQPVAAGVPS